LLICCILVAAAAVALVLLTGFGQPSGPSAPQQTPASSAGVPSSPAALHRHASSTWTQLGLTHGAARDAALAAAGLAGGVPSAGHTAATPGQQHTLGQQHALGPRPGTRG
jgi:hypothetical protein